MVHDVQVVAVLEVHVLQLAAHIVQLGPLMEYPLPLLVHGPQVLLLPKKYFGNVQLKQLVGPAAEHVAQVGSHTTGVVQRFAPAVQVVQTK